MSKLQTLIKLVKTNDKTVLKLTLLGKIKPLLSDERFLKFRFQIKMGYPLNLKLPRTFNEKLNWLKLYDHQQVYTTMVDKLMAKQYVRKRLGGGINIPTTIGVWDSVDEIEWERLPERFVLKTTHGGGSAGVLVCKNKSELNIEEARKKLLQSMRQDIYKNLCEWPYKNVVKRVFAEEYLDNGTGKTLSDYKFYCFDGAVKCLYVSEGLEDPETARISFLTTDWQFAPFVRTDYSPLETLPQRPSLFEQMLTIASRLSKGVPFLRVDLYQIKEKIYFSELTFFPCSGMMKFEPEEWDGKLGEYLTLPAIKTN